MNVLIQAGLVDLIPTKCACPRGGLVVLIPMNILVQKGLVDLIQMNVCLSKAG